MRASLRISRVKKKKGGLVLSLGEDVKGTLIVSSEVAPDLAKGANVTLELSAQMVSDLSKGKSIRLGPEHNAEFRQNGKPVVSAAPAAAGVSPARRNDF